MFGINNAKKYKEYDLGKLTKKVKHAISDHRFVHTMGVAYTAAALAMRYECDINHAMTAGILHDCAKGMTEGDLIKWCEKNKMSVSDVEKLNPELLHAKVGSVLAEKKYGVKDEEIITAIKYHTTGKPNMSLLGKIIYISDFIEPNRRELEGIAEIRKVAFIDIDKAMIMILKSCLKYLNEKGSLIDSLTQETYDYYVSEQLNNIEDMN